MSKKPATHVQYGGALYRLKEGGGLGTTREEATISLFDKDFDSEGELKYSGGPDGGQFSFESRVKFADGEMFPVSVPISEEMAVQIFRKLLGRNKNVQFPDKWQSMLPPSFLEVLRKDIPELPEEDVQKALPLSTASVTTKPIQVTATIHPWRVSPSATVAKINLRLGSAGADELALGLFARKLQFALTAKYPNARVAVSVDRSSRTNGAYLSVRDKAGADTKEHDRAIQEMLTSIWQRMHSYSRR